MDSSLFTFTSDLPDDDLDTAVEGIRDRFGVDGLTVAAAYHQARDVTPHGRSRLVLRHDGVHFPLDPALFSGIRLTPPTQDDARTEPLVRLRAATRRHGMALHGWVVLCHNTTLGTRHPDSAVQSCFGDRAAPADLCPANPEVREYVTAVAREVARRGVDSVVAESLHYGTFDHGYHHERALVPLGAVERFAFGLCFCGHCRRRAHELGVDAEAARAECVTALERVFGGGSPSCEEISRSSLAQRVGQATLAYVDCRNATVASLTAEVSEAVRAEGSRLVFLDMTGAKGYADGDPGGDAAATECWQRGIDPTEISRHVHEYGVLAYARSERRVVEDLASYRAACRPETKLRAVLRPGPPDTFSSEHLTNKVAGVREVAEAVDFYHYGLNTLTDLDRIPPAIGMGPVPGGS